MHETAVGRPMEILLVEDSLMSARVTIGALKNSAVQHRMTWLKDGMDASSFLGRNGLYTHAPRPDLILLDLELPGKDGRELLQQVRSDDALSNTPVVILTSSTDAEDIAETGRLEVDGYLNKPVDLTKFLKLVQDLSRFWRDDMIVPAATH
jgi:CheY-like chemotaxis protein